jgi:hypothetical protein
MVKPETVGCFLPPSAFLVNARCWFPTIMIVEIGDVVSVAMINTKDVGE